MRLSSMIGPAPPRPVLRPSGPWLLEEWAKCFLRQSLPLHRRRMPRIPTGGGRTFGLDFDIMRALPRLLFGWRARAVSGQVNQRHNMPSGKTQQ